MSRIKRCVSLYSLQDQYMTGKMNLEDLFQFLHENGVEGVEVLPDQMIHGAPNPTEETLAHWNSLCEKYQIEPVIADIFLNTNLYKNRELTVKECVELLIEEIIQANRLGVKMVRMVSMTPYYVLEPILPYCEKYDVKVALEIHAGISFEKKQTKDFIDEMKRLNSPYIGIVVDTGIFCKRLPRVVGNYCKAIGANAELIETADRIYAERGDGRAFRDAQNNVIPELTSLCKSGADFMFASIADGYENEPYEILDEYMPSIFHFHFKMFEMTEDGEYSIDFKGILEYLHSKGYDGYVSTEYEGNRWTMPGMPTVEKEQVVAHQKYIRKCLEEIQGV